MISLPIDEHGKKKAPFTRPDVPKPEVAGTCEKCGGGTRFEEFTNWNATEGTTRKRIYRCTQHAGRCPAVTVTLGQDGQEEETMAKTKSGGLVCLQTLEWCNQVKAAIIAKHLAYKDVAKDASISQSSLAQGLNMHMSLSEESQKRIEAAVAKAERWESVTARRMAEKRKAKAATDKIPASLRVSDKTFEAIEALAKETEETILRNLESQEAVPPGATVTWSEEQPRPGLIPTLVTPEGQLKAYPHDDGSGAQVVVGELAPERTVTGLHNVREFGPGNWRCFCGNNSVARPGETCAECQAKRVPGVLETEMLDVKPDNLEPTGLPTGTGRAEVAPETPPLEEVYAELVRVGCATPAEAGDMLDKEAEKQPLGSVERRLLASAGNYYDLVQRHKALECRVQDLAERAEERFTAFAQGHQLHEDRLGRMELSQVEAASDAEDQDIANAKRFQDLDDRLTESHNHLSEQIADQPAPVARAPFDGLDEWLEDNWWRRADRMVQELSVYTDSQLQALVTAATARRDLLKSLEAA